MLASAGISGDLFCAWQAISYLILSVAARLAANDLRTRLAFEWAAWLALNNAYDEVFGDPKNVSTFEVSFAIIVTTWTIYSYIKKCQLENNT